MTPAVTPPVKVGIVSLAQYHGNFWSQALQSSEHAELVAIWDEDAERGQAGAQAPQPRQRSSAPTTGPPQRGASHRPDR